MREGRIRIIRLMNVSLKVDQKTKMGIITDVKNALRKSYALKINYSATKRGEK